MIFAVFSINLVFGTTLGFFYTQKLNVLMCLNVLVTFLIFLDIFTYFYIVKKNISQKP